MQIAKRRRSIIDHTTTCPYCGHRVLPENLDRHIQSQHPTLAEDEAITKKMITPGLNPCPYCRKEIPLNHLEEHLHQEHSEEIIQVAAKLREKERSRKHVKAIRRRTANDPKFKIAKIKSEWRQIKKNEEANSRTEQGKNLVFCRYCYQPVQKGELQEHIKTYHPDS